MQRALTIVIPTRDRRQTLLETLRRVDIDAHGLNVEIVVVDDGSRDGTVDAARAMAGRLSVELRVLSHRGAGPGAARNRGIAAARGNACLLLGDDIRPRRGMLRAHVEYHAHRADLADALVGRVVPAPPLDRSEFMRWLHDRGAVCGFARIEGRDRVSPRFLYASNTSLKTEFLRAAGGFDESFGFGYEELDLALRLDRVGMRLRYDPGALAEHAHPMGLEETVARMRQVGKSYRLLLSRQPDQTRPRRPGPRHRLLAASLTGLTLLGLRKQALRHEVWRFLCDEAHREGFWDLKPAPDRRLVVGDRLCRLALADVARTREPE